MGGAGGATSRVRDVHAFDAATRVTRAGEGRYQAFLDEQWSIGGRLNGGYLLAVMTRAVLAEAGEGHEHPLAVTGAFAAAAQAGPALVTVEPLRLGRGTSVLRARLGPPDGGTASVEALVTAGRIADGAPVLPGPPRPDLPPEESCPRAQVDTGPMHVPLLGQLAERLDPATAGFAVGRPSGGGELRAWVRFDDGREPDLLALVMIADALPPPSFDVPGLALGWVPTLQYSVYLRAMPAPGPLTVRTVARSIGGGAVDESCDVWDATGRLVAVSSQLAAVRPA
jgi:Thioesterase-like superfamily